MFFDQNTFEQILYLICMYKLNIEEVLLKNDIQ